MTLNEVISLKQEVESELTTPTAGIRLMQNRIDAGLANKFVQSLLDRPLRDLPMIFEANTPGLVGAAFRGRSLTASLLENARSLMAHGVGEDTKNPNLSIGYSEVKANRYRVEVRFQRASVHTALLVQEVVHRANGEARVGEYRKLMAYPGSTAAAGGTAVTPGLQIGGSVGHQKGPPGTLGLFLKSSNRVGILSNSHILARCGRAKRGDPIYAPHPKDAEGAREIARLDCFSSLIQDDEVPLDAAFALLNDGVRHQGNFIPAGMPEAGKRLAKTKVMPANLGLEVCKIGRTSQHTAGTLGAVAVSPTIEYPGLGEVKLTGMLEIQWSALNQQFSQPGDSGSVVYRPDTMEAFGIVVGGGERVADGKTEGVSIVCPLDVIMNTWNLSFV
jgi:hypothetical protein